MVAGRKGEKKGALGIDVYCKKKKKKRMEGRIYKMILRERMVDTENTRGGIARVWRGR